MTRVMIHKGFNRAASRYKILLIMQIFKIMAYFCDHYASEKSLSTSRRRPSD
jgi:hypothetical protein